MRSTPCAEDYAKKAHEIVSAFVAADLFSGVVLAAKNGEVIFRQAFGIGNREWEIPNTPETKFRIGSITKQFTAAAILRLAERGKLNVADRLGQYFPEIPRSWHDVTIHQLLTHTSGVPSYTNLPDFLSRMSLEERTPQQIIELTSGQALDFPSGDRFSYSNTGYVLLGCIVESVSAQTYPAFLNDEFFLPLGMVDSGYDDTSKIVECRAAGYTCIDGKWRHARFIAMSLPYAAGGLYSTADDLYLWSKALMNGDVIQPSLLQEMVRDQGHGYGYGWFVGSVGGRSLVNHGGAINGFLGTLDLHIDDDLTVIVLSNLQGSEVSLIAERLALTSFGEYQPRHEIALAKSELIEFVGVFRLGHRCFLEISLTNESLCASFSGHQRLQLACSGSDAFFSKTGDIEITFERDVEGKIATASLLERNSRVVGRRVDDTIRPTENETQPQSLEDTSANSAEDSQYVGRYRYPRMYFDVTVEGDQLSIQATGQPKLKATRRNDRCFVLEEVHAEVTFELTESGAVWGMTLQQGGTQIRAYRLFDACAD
jgi:D-alanyl-D-alanine carboxypeptidase